MTHAIALLALGSMGQQMTSTFAKDPVALIRDGKEIDGRAELVHKFGNFEYLFSSAANLAEFKSNPSKYEIQWGGACGRMGPLSGAGYPTHYAVHAKKLYVFASKQCREAFLKNPSVYLEREDSMPARTTPNSPLAAKFLTWSGGREAILNLGALTMYRAAPTEYQGKTYRVGEQTVFDPKAGYAQQTWWDDAKWSSVLNGSTGYLVSSRGVTNMHPQQVRAFQKVRNTAYEVVLHALAAKSARVHEPNLPDDRGRIDVWHDGNLIIVRIDPTSGKIKSMEFTGRGANSTVGRLRHSYVSFSEFRGVRLPNAWNVSFNGKPEETMNKERMSWRPGNTALLSPAH